MTIVRIGRTNVTAYMDFAFDSAMDAFVFYSLTKDAYREDDLVIEMTEEGEDE